VSFSNEADDGGQAVQLELMSTVSGRLMVIPGTWLSSDALISFGWPASSDSLVAELSFTTKAQLMSWRPGASRLAIAALRPQQSPVSLVIGRTPPSASRTGTRSARTTARSEKKIFSSRTVRGSPCRANPGVCR
jgi:hypothetical protein